VRFPSRSPFVRRLSLPSVIHYQGAARTLIHLSLPSDSSRNIFLAFHVFARISSATKPQTERSLKNCSPLFHTVSVKPRWHRSPVTETVFAEGGPESILRPHPKDSSTWDSRRREMRSSQKARKAGSRGGLVVSPSPSVMPDVSLGKVLAICELVKEKELCSIRV